MAPASAFLLVQLQTLCSRWVAARTPRQRASSVAPLTMQACACQADEMAANGEGIEDGTLETLYERLDDLDASTVRPRGLHACMARGDAFSLFI